MNREMDHSRCSELLGAFARGRLPVDEAREVKGHLDSCAECSEELIGVALLMRTEPAKLDDVERQNLHARVAEGIGPRQPVILGAGLGKNRKKSLLYRFAPTFSAAALLLLVAIVALTGGGRFGDEEPFSAGRGADTVEESDSASKDAAGDGGAQGAAAPEAIQDQEKEERVAGKIGKDSAGPPRPVFAKRTLPAVPQGKELNSRTTSAWFQGYTLYDVADAERKADRFVALLGKEAPANVRAQVRECSNIVRLSQDAPLLPAYGVLGRVKERPALTLGFVYTTASSGPLSDYMLWTWPRGSCSTRLGYSEGSLED